MSVNNFKSSSAWRDARVSLETLHDKPLHAEAQRRFSLIHAEVQGSLHRLGVKVPADGRVDIHELNKVFAASGLTTHARMNLKTQMAQLGMID
jgi:hypothetical protein